MVTLVITRLSTPVKSPNASGPIGPRKRSPERIENRTGISDFGKKSRIASIEIRLCSHSQPITAQCIWSEI